MLCRGTERDPRQLKGCERKPPFEAMLSLELRSALYSRAEIHKDRKGLEYQYHVLMITMLSPKSFPEPTKEDDEDG